MEAIFYARPCVFSEGLDGEVQRAKYTLRNILFFSQTKFYNNFISQKTYVVFKCCYIIFL